MKSSIFFKTQRTAKVYAHLKMWVCVCVCVRSILKATLVTSYKNIWPNK